MATNNNNANRLRVSELDFEEIKSNFKEFLKGQETFADYNYEGSGLAVIVDLLAYNTHYNAVLANMQANERFIDSAVSRSSVVSIAKQYDYYPQSYSSATATVDITVNSPSGAPATLTLPKNTPFSSVLNGTSYQFITTENYNIHPVSGVYKFSGVKLKEGKLKTYTYIASTIDSSQKYIIPEYNVDISSLNVYVQTSTTDTTLTKYYESKDITLNNSTSNVYYVQGAIDNNYEIYFGDGILGNVLVDGNLIILEYVVCNGSIANDLYVFKLAGSISGNTNVAIKTTITSNSGKEFEDIDSIRKNAIRSYTTQNRFVTIEDYKTLLPQLYPNIRSLSVWAGDENVPPEYGTVYISIEPTNAGTLSALQKKDIIDNIIRPKKIASIVTKIVDPKYIFIEIASAIYYDKNNSRYDANTLKLLTKNAVAIYNNTELLKFGGVFRYSKLAARIDAIDSSILSNITTFRLHQYVSPIYNVITQYNIEFNNPIYKNSFGTPEEAITSSGFKIFGDDRVFYLEDDGTKNIRMYYISNMVKLYHSSVGTVDYVLGSVNIILNITYFVPGNAGDPGIQFSVKTQSFDIVPVRNTILRIKDNDIDVTVISDDIAGGYDSSGAARTFTSSR